MKTLLSSLLLASMTLPLAAQRCEASDLRVGPMPAWRQIQAADQPMGSSVAVAPRASATEDLPSGLERLESELKRLAELEGYRGVQVFGMRFVDLRSMLDAMNSLAKHVLENDLSRSIGRAVLQWTESARVGLPPAAEPTAPRCSCEM